METKNKEEYNEYSSKFFAKYDNDYSWRGLNEMGFKFFDRQFEFFAKSPQSILAARLSGRTVDQICTNKKGIAFDSNYFSNISVESFGSFGHGLNVFTVDKESPYPVEKKCDVLKFNPIFLVDGKFPSNDYDKWHTFLNYDGLCAFLAMAPEKMLLDNKEFVINEIKRNASEEMREVKLSEKSVDKIKDEIGEKYLELSGAALVMFEQANERLLMEEAEQARLAEEQAKFEAEQESLKTEYEQDLRDNEARTAEAYAGVMEKLDLFSKINDENLGQNE